MSAALNHPSPAHTWFMNNLAEIQSRSRVRLKHLSGDRQDEALAEVVGAVFKASVHAQRRGVLDRITPFHAVNYAVRQFRVGRRLAGTSTTDVLSEAAYLMGRCKVISLSTALSNQLTGESKPLTIADTLSDAKHDSPAEQVRQNLDYPAILKREQVSPKARAVFGHLVTDRAGSQGLRIAKALGVSPARVCQLKEVLADALARNGYGPESTQACAG